MLKNDKPVVVDFWATWCGPCKMVAPEMEKIAAKYEGAVDVVKVDVDANPRISQAFNIMSIPTIAFFRPGQQPLGMAGALAEGGDRGPVRARPVHPGERADRGLRSGRARRAHRTAATPPVRRAASSISGARAGSVPTRSPDDGR